MLVTEIVFLLDTRINCNFTNENKNSTMDRVIYRKQRNSAKS